MKNGFQPEQPVLNSSATFSTAILPSDKFTIALQERITNLINACDAILFEKSLKISFESLLHLMLSAMNSSSLWEVELKNLFEGKLQIYDWHATSLLAISLAELHALSHADLKTITGILDVYAQAPFVPGHEDESIVNSYHKATVQHVTHVVEQLKTAKCFKSFADYRGITATEALEKSLSTAEQQKLQQERSKLQQLVIAVDQAKIIFNHEESVTFYVFLLRVFHSIQSLTEQRASRAQLIDHLKAHYHDYHLPNNQALKDFSKTILTFKESIYPEATSSLVMMITVLEQDRKKILRRYYESSWSLKHSHLPKEKAIDDWVAQQEKIESLSCHPTYLNPINKKYSSQKLNEEYSLFKKPAESKKKRTANEAELEEESAIPTPIQR